MNIINIQENLINVPALTHARMIGVSALNLINAGVLANDTRECAEEARRIYGHINRRGMWKRIQSDARKLIISANKSGITFEKPYFIKDGIVYGALSDEIVPLF